ncbi:T-lymphocyte activation antigen CD80 isoform X2 [Austrofundulus limnaeus]|uniref:T-lymphocyte activation antigen CD80 isoform X2 n=1 Tax=Austrofundulus limnaeus TaxID=52670 RepID=A0A2I4C6Q0_AUSLI|nr:PREDICTED: T-lymphocyte activation antigen CD80-like isoform X2 [Austrofundulus limnaeus]
MCPQECMVPVLALWYCAGLLLSSVHLCAGVECILGIVGQPILLPCLYHELSVNFSIEWRKDDKVVLRSVWDDKGNVETWSLNHASIPADAARSGNFSLELPAVHPREDGVHYSLFLISGENQSSPLCSVCFKVAASFSISLLKREHMAGNETTFLCHSTGGYPKPSVYWLINNTLQPPKGSVRTLTEFDLSSHFFSVTSNLTISVSKNDNVSCIVENPSMNETLRYTYKPNDDEPVQSRASEAMWIFSTGLCVVVGIMVIAGVAYQIHLDNISKRRKKEYREEKRGYRRRQQNREEDEVMTSESRETEL